MALSSGLSATGKAVVKAIAAIDPGPITVALSGGPDSAVVAWACAVSRPAGSVRAVHIDHGWEAAEELRRAALAVAEHLEMPIEIVAVKPRSGPSREGVAREARLPALADAAKGDQIVTGHHADDAVETVVGNLLRGAGMTGLAGIAPSRGPFRRPLLSFRRADLRKLAEELRLPFVDDPSNDDVSLRRNLVRQQILPELDRYLDGDLADVVGRSARLLAMADGVLDDISPSLAVTIDEGAHLVAAAPLQTVAEVLAQRAVRRVLRLVHPPYPGTSREVGAVLAVAYGESPRADLSDGLIVEREGPHLAFYRPNQAELPEPAELTVPGTVVFGNHTIAARTVVGPEKLHMSHDRCRVALDSNDLVVRHTRPGDFVDIGGGRKSVSDAFSESALPVRKRSAWPVVESHGRIVWVAGVRVAAWARNEAPSRTWIELERHHS